MTDDHIQRLLDLMARLRAPEGGCPWDVEQTFRTIAPHTIEEAYEVADAVEQGDMVGLRGELGDLLFQVVFHARMAEEAGHFSFADVAADIHDKMVARHPHVFGEANVASAAAQTAAWEDHKERERKAAARAGNAPAPSALDGVTRGLPALLRAAKLQRRAARVGFDWAEPDEVLDKIAEEVEELADEMRITPYGDLHARFEDELGDLLFSCVNLARKLEVDPETALRHANAKFERRFRHMEAKINGQGRSIDAVSMDELDELWEDAKAETMQ